MENNKVGRVAWDPKVSDKENRARRIAVIIKGTKCKKPEDIREWYLSIYEDDPDCPLYEEHRNYQTKALKIIPNLIVPKNKDDYYEIAEDPDLAFYTSLKNLFKENKMKIKIVQTARVILPRSCANEFISMIEKQFTNIVSIETRYVKDEKEAVFVTYTKKMPKPRAKKENDEEIYYYDEDDFYETMQLINIDA